MTVTDRLAEENYGIGGRSFPERRRERRADLQDFLPFVSRFASPPSDVGVAWAHTLVEAFTIITASVVAGTAYSLFVLGYWGATETFFGNGVLVSSLFCAAMRAREGKKTWAGQDSTRDLFVVWSQTFLLLSFVWFFLKLDPDLSRGAIVLFFVLGFPAVALARRKAPDIIAAYYHPRKLSGHHALLVGATGQTILESLEREFGFTGCASVSTIKINSSYRGPEWQAALHLAVQDIRLSARTAGHGQICVAAAGFTESQLASLLVELQSIPRAIRLVPETTVERYLHLPTRSLGRVRAIEIQGAPLSAFQRVIKRTIDLSVGVPVLICLTPILLAIALWVAADSPGPVLFRQRRFGYQGRPFTILKFRTMTTLEDGNAVTQASRSDPRITRAGRYLRRMSLDELPQLLNVIRGEMSLVGPRPHACAHDEAFAALIGNYELRQHVKPGITGWAQINGLRGETATTELMRMRVEYDLWYAKNASNAMDIRILARTILEVFRQRNAY